MYSMHRKGKNKRHPQCTKVLHCSNFVIIILDNLTYTKAYIVILS